ncbi:uncharacterized protein CMC5_025220 [Chondromyces crocatus]|uniref:Uncharacterized protein n=2 Tax=Chondromyces crocatus TaxID=52 RepID=A0A0K1EBW2_CHOCO|nr:uncharacterized protein CMC5_025220 [Chondromyces crocatus]
MPQGPSGKLLDHLRRRGPVALLFVGLAVGVRFAAPAPPPRSVDAIAAMLGEAVGGSVGVDDFVWEERGGFLHDALLGRRVLFLAKTPEGVAGSHADLFRASVRLTRTGRPLGLHTVRNLSQTPVGDDRGLVARGRHAAFVNVTPGIGVQSITLLDLGGEVPEHRSRSERFLAMFEGWLESGSTRGVTRTEISFGTPPPEALVDLTDELLLMGLGPERTPASVDLREHVLNTGGKEAYRPEVHAIGRPLHSFVEVATSATQRWFGVEKAREVERALLDAERRFHPLPPESAIVGEPVSSTGSASTSPEAWPPGAIPAVLTPALPGEGVWVAAKAPFGGEGSAAATPETPNEPLFLATYVRPDARSVHASVHLLAIDTRRIELRFQAGYDAPRPVAGPRGTGRLPAPSVVPPAGAGAEGGGAEGQPADEGEVSSAPSLLGAIALGWEPDHGVVVEGHPYVPPRIGEATIAVDRHGRALLGRWPGAVGVAETITSLFQGASLPGTPRAAQEVGDSDEVAAPAGGGAAWDDDLVTERSALCVTAGGYLLHAWSRAVDAPALARVLSASDCRSSLQLGRHPARLGFAWLGERDGGWVAARSVAGMTLVSEQLTSASPGAFAYLLRRGTAPEVSPRRAVWALDGATQPAPLSVPAVHTAEVVNLGARVRLTAFSPERFEMRLRAGSREISPRGAPELPKSLSAEEHARALASIGFGIGRRRGALGLSIDDKVGLRLRNEGGLLVVQGRRIDILPAGATLPEGAAATELPLVAEGGKLLPGAREIGSRRKRGAACVLEDGTLVVANTTFDSDEATTEALLDLGCHRVVAFDRGARRPTFLHRSGSVAAPSASQEEPTEPSEGAVAPEAAEPSGDKEPEDMAPLPVPEPELPPTLRAGYDDTTLFLLEASMSGRVRPL